MSVKAKSASGTKPPADDARRLVELLRERGTDPVELRRCLAAVLIDANVLFHLAYEAVGEKEAHRYMGARMRRRSKAQSDAAETYAATVRGLIDDLRRRESGLKNSMLADRLNELKIAAPRGGTWSEAQVYRVLRRTGGTRRPKRKNRPVRP